MIKVLRSRIKYDTINLQKNKETIEYSVLIKNQETEGGKFMKIRQTIFLLPLFLLAGCASAGGSQSRDLDLKELCTEEQVFQYADFEWGTDSEQLFKQSSLKFDEKDLGQGDESSTKTYESKEKFSLENAESNMDLEFSDGQLSQVSFTFDIEQDANTWIQKEVDELNSLYGGGIATGLGNQIYQWQGEQDTVLQLTAFTEGDESATVILSVASMEYSIGS